MQSVWIRATAQSGWNAVRAVAGNPVYRRLRQIYCVAGAEFCRPDLEAAWKEIERLSDALEVIARNVDAGAVHVSWCGDYAKRAAKCDGWQEVTP